MNLLVTPFSKNIPYKNNPLHKDLYKIYIVFPTKDHKYGDVYIGWTLHPLDNRMTELKTSYRQGVLEETAPELKSLIDKYDINLFDIRLLHICSTKKEMYYKQYELRHLYKCVNSG